MKKHTLFLLLFILPLLSISQNRFAVFGGISNTTLSDGFLKHIPIESSFTIHVGGLYEYSINNNLSFRPKMVISLQGDRFDEGITGNINSSTIDYKLTYLNIPLNLKFFSKPYIIAGPQVGVLLSTQKGELDFGSIRSNVDFGANLGLGYDFNSFFVEVNAYQGISTLLKFEVSGTSNKIVEATNTVIQFSVGYYFD